MLIKICGVKDPEIAFFAGCKYADYIGMIFHKESARYVDLEQAKKIAVAAKRGGAKPVAVFTDHTVEEMREILEFTQVSVVQLHGEVSRKNHHKLPSDIQRIFVLEVRKDGTIMHETKVGKEHLEKERDLLLFDGISPGKGVPFHWDRFSPNETMPFFLAGGLTPSNVEGAVISVHPAGCDVSSGVEIDGKKDKRLIEEFIKNARGDQIRRELCSGAID